MAFALTSGLSLRSSLRHSSMQVEMNLALAQHEPGRESVRGAPADGRRRGGQRPGWVCLARQAKQLGQAAAREHQVDQRPIAGTRVDLERPGPRRQLALRQLEVGPALPRPGPRLLQAFRIHPRSVEPRLREATAG